MAHNVINSPRFGELAHATLGKTNSLIHAGGAGVAIVAVVYVSGVVVHAMAHTDF